jgi:hypothetical protein
MGKTRVKYFKEKSFTHEPQSEDRQGKEAPFATSNSLSKKPPLRHEKFVLKLRVRPCIDPGSEQAVIRRVFLAKKGHGSDHADSRDRKGRGIDLKSAEEKYAKTKRASAALRVAEMCPN